MQTSRINQTLAFITFLVMLSGGVYAQNNLQLKQIWKKHIRGVNGEEVINGLTIAPNGNILVSGRYTTSNLGASVDVNFPANVYFLSQTGGYSDGFAINYSQAGAVNWAARYNRNNNDAYYDISVAPNNTPYAVGGDNTGFSGFAHANTLISQINNSTGGLTSSTSSNGDLTNRFNSAAVDQAGNVYAGGMYSGNPDFNMSRGTTVTLGLASSHQDAMLVKHNENRGVIWAKRFGSTGYDEISRVIVKGNNLYVVGSFTGKVDFNPSTVIADTFFLQTPSALVSNGFILKLDTAGNFIDAWTIASTAQNVLNDIVVNSANEIYVSGYYSGTVDANPESGVNNISSSGSMDALLLKLDATGNLIWSRSFGGTQDDRFTRIVLNNNGDVFGCGYFASSSVDFGSPNQNILNNAGAAGTTDGFIVAYSSAGNNLVAHKYGGSTNDYVTGVAMDSLYQLYVAVNFTTPIQTEFLSGYSSITTQGGGSDAVLIKYNTICPYIIQSSTDAYACLAKNIRLDNIVIGTNLSKQWKFGGNNIFDGSKYNGVNSDTLSIQNLTPSDTGIYSLEVSRSGCATVSILQIRVGSLTGNSFVTAAQHYPMNGSVKSTTASADPVIAFPTTSNFGPNRFGTANKAFRIVNTSMSLNIPDVSGAKQSYAFWFQPVGGGNALSTLLWNGVNSSNRMLATNNNVLGTYINNVFTGFGVTLANNQWNHVVLVKDSSRCLVYINGVKRFDSLTLFTSGSITVTELFGQSNWAQGAMGFYDDVRVYNTAIGLDEITTIYNQIDFQTIPRNVAKCVGEQALVPVSFGDDTALTYQWYKNGALLNNGGAVSQVNNDTLSITSGSLNEAGYYYARATKDCFEAYSDSVWLTFENADLSNGLLSNYTFNGNVLDNISNRNMTGTAIYGGTSRYGNPTNTLLNANNFATSLSFTPVNNDTISVAIWYYVMQSGLRTLIGSSNGSASHLVIDANNQVGFRLANANVIASGVPVNNNSWYHFVVTKAGTNQKIYLNGNLIMDVNNSFLNSITNNALARIANSSLGDSRSYGHFDDMFVYTRELNGTEVNAIYKRFNTARQPALVRACDGSNNTVMLSAAFEYSDTTQYTMQWLHKGNPISNGVKYQGVNSDTLVVYNVTAADSGAYSVRVTPNQVACANWRTSNGILQLDGPSLMKDSLILHQKFNGSVTDNSGRGQASFNVNATYTTDRFGTPNSAINFDGTLAYVNTPNVTATNAPVLTVMAWFKSNQATGGIISSVSSLPTTNPSSSHALLYIGNDNKLHGKSWNGGTNAMSSPNDVNDNQWHHAALVVEGNNGTQRLYLDGVLVGTLNTSASSLSNTILVGAIFGNTNWFSTNTGWNYFQGQIDEVKVFNKALSPEEIARLAQSIGFAENGTQQIGFCNNSSANIVARPQGSGVSLQWYKNGVAISPSANVSGVTNDTLSFTTITPSDTGVYQLMATKECFSVMSDSIKVGVFNTIVKTQLPTNRNVCMFDSTAFAVQALGASLTYQWFKGNTALIDGAKYSGTTSNVLSVKMIQYAEAGQYRLRMSDQCNNVDSTIIVSLSIVPTAPPIVPSATEIYALNGNYTATNSGVNNGSNMGSAAATNRFGTVNGAMSFVSSNANYATLPAAIGISARLNYTVSLWFKTSTTLSNQGLFGCSNVTPASGSPATYHPMLYITNGGTLAGKMYNGNYNAMVSTMRVDDGKWHHAVLAYSAATGTQRLMLDGVLVGSIFSGSINTGSGLIPTIGATFGSLYTGHNTGWSYFNGEIDDVRIFNTYAMTDATVANQVFMKSEFAPASSELVCSGQTQVSFRSGIYGTPTAYQWKRNGVAITDVSKYTGFTTDTLTVLNFNASDTGSYSCEFWNGCYNGTANNRNVMFGTIPVVNAQPNNASSCAGGSVVLAAGANGGGLNYQWRKNATPLTNGGNISGANTASLTISNLAASDTGAYTCFIANVCGNTTTNNAQVSLSSGLQIIQQPANVTACTAANAQLVIITTDPNATYQWRKNGSNINNSNNDTLFLNNITSADAGSYSVQVTSVCGSTTSNSATLTILPVATISSQPQSTAACIGNQVVFSVAANGSNLTYQWRKNGVDINGATASTFTINAYSNGDAGMYTCVVGSACNSITSNVAVLSNSTPVAISSQSNPVLILCPNVPDPMVNISVNATGSVQGYQWFKDGVAISGAVNATYTFNRLLTASGTFYCKVFGACDTVNSANINYQLQVPPVIAQQPSGQSICSGQTLILKAIIQTNFTPTYRWFKDGVALNDGGSISGAFTDSLVVSGASPSDNGSYRLDVTLCGATQSTQVANITVNSQNTMVSQSAAAVSACSGQNIQLYVNPSVASSVFQWKKDGVNIANATNDTLLLTATTAGDNGTYTCDITSACGNVVSSNIVVTVNATPTPTILLNGTVLSTQTFSSYQWRLNGSNISGANQQTFTPTQNGNYSVSVLSNGCSAISPDYNYTISGVADLQVQLVKWYPNPAQKHLTIEMDTYQGATLKIFGVDGKLISIHQLMSSVQQISIETLTPGMYILVVESDSKKTLFDKFIKQ